jgi:superfamily I DNA/RNA helicase
MVEAALEKQGVLSQWMSENYRSKKAYDITTDRVTISTIHSAKGLDYSVVFILGLDYLTPKGWTEEQIDNLVYVGITRARYRLIIPYVNESPLLDRLKRSLAISG